VRVATPIKALKLHDYGESGWEIDHVVAHGENQNAMLFCVQARD
jgi:hypothetical protein